MRFFVQGCVAAIGLAFLVDAISSWVSGTGTALKAQWANITVEKDSALDLYPNTQGHAVNAIPHSFPVGTNAPTTFKNEANVQTAAGKQKVDFPGIKFSKAEIEEMTTHLIASNVMANPNGHMFVMTKNKNKIGRSVLCVPQKNGNQNFMGLVYAFHNGTAPKNVNVAFDGAQQHEIEQAGENDIVYFITRNPYTRLLSLYKNKVTWACKGQPQIKCGQRAFLGMGPETTFKEFVKRVTKRKEAVGNEGLCTVNHHLCLQTQTCITTSLASSRVIVLKLEEQATWFASFIDSLKMNISVLSGKEWKQFSGRSCYYSGTGDCRDML